MTDEPPPTADPNAYESIDGLITDLYASISFRRDQRPDWSRFRGLFEPGARLFKIEGELVVGSDLDAFARRIVEEIEAGALASFDEREIARRTDVFAGIAQVFSTYERVAEGRAMARGINALQLFHDGRRWWIASMIWSDEGGDRTLPVAYLPRD